MGNNHENKVGVRVYMDYAASTPADSRVVSAMKPYWGEEYGNPSALHTKGRTARKAVEDARESVAQALSCKPDELIFTSGGTESNNLALFGIPTEGAHLVTSVIEHPSVLDCFKVLEERGARVSYVAVDAEGVIDLEAFKKTLEPGTKLVSVMFANNEIGTIQPIARLKALMREVCPEALLHTDASQAPLFYALDVDELGVDLLTIDGQKMYGPKGVGALYVQSGVVLRPLFLGGKQEKKLRPGTENVPGIVGLGAAYVLAEKHRSEDVDRLIKLRDYFIDAVLMRIPGSVCNGSRKDRLPNNVNISFPNVEGEYLVLQLDSKGIACGTRSACFGAGGEGSPVVATLDADRADSAVRFSLGRETTKEDVDYVLETLEGIVGTSQ